MESPRPLGSILAVVLLEVIAFGTFALGVLLMVAGASLELGAAGAVVGIVAVASFATAVFAVVAGFGVWQGRAWGWAIAMAISVVGLLGVVAATLSGAFQAQLVIAIFLFGGLMASLLVPSVRSRSGIG